uniref:Uncharacterized protein n=1 Tax=Oryza rufipogon TaxID=4529 RepID=A0A0E0RH66_ORYRU
MASRRRSSMLANSGTRRTRRRQRCRFTSRRRSLGRLRTRLSSSTPRVSSHRYWSCRHTRSWRSTGSTRWRIHCSESRRRSRISSSRSVIDCRYVCMLPMRSAMRMRPNTARKMANRASPFPCPTVLRFWSPHQRQKSTLATRFVVDTTPDWIAVVKIPYWNPVPASSAGAHSITSTCRIIVLHSRKPDCPRFPPPQYMYFLH